MITSDAGIGKTTALRETGFLRSKQKPAHLSMFLDISRIINPRSRIFDPKRPNSSYLVEHFCRIVSTPIKSAKDLILDRITAGEFTLLVDGLDQIGTRSKKNALSCVEPIADFLKSYPQVKAVLGSRPWAVEFFFEGLYEQTGPWKICRVEKFTDTQIQYYLGSDRYLALKGLDVDLLPVPRILDRVFETPLANLSSMRSAAEVYWKYLFPLLTGGLTAHIQGMNAERLILLLSLMAWVMVRNKIGISVSEGNDFQHFLNQAWTLGKSTLKSNGVHNQDSLLAYFGKVAALNIGVGYALFSNPQMTEVLWQDKSLRDFFAAVWITRYGTKDTLEWLAGNPGKVGTDEYHVWRFAAGMPNEGWVRDNNRYAPAMATLYRQADASRATERCSEIIYHSLGEMLRLTGAKESADVSIDFKSGISTLKDLYRPSTGDTTPSGIARNALLEFYSEFDLIRNGSKGSHFQEVAESIVNRLSGKSEHVGSSASGRREDIESLYGRVDDLTFYEAYVISSWLGFGTPTDIHILYEESS